MKQCDNRTQLRNVNYECWNSHLSSFTYVLYRKFPATTSYTQISENESPRTYLVIATPHTHKLPKLPFLPIISAGAYLNNIWLLPCSSGTLPAPLLLRNPTLNSGCPRLLPIISWINFERLIFFKIKFAASRCRSRKMRLGWSHHAVRTFLYWSVRFNKVVSFVSSVQSNVRKHHLLLLER